MVSNYNNLVSLMNIPFFSRALALLFTVCSLFFQHPDPNRMFKIFQQQQAQELSSNNKNNNAQQSMIAGNQISFGSTKTAPIPLSNSIVVRFQLK